MLLGAAIFPTDESIGPAALARAVEEAGLESFWLPEHSHIPVSRRTPYPAGGELPREYSRTLDPFVALGAAAAVTERIGLGFGVCLLMQRDPIITAKEVASLDHISAGRVLFGVGAGWNEEEMLDHGTDPRRRFGILRERVGALRAIWSEEEASYQGEHVAFEPMWSWPKPVQRPGPPVLIGGNGRGVLDRVLDYGDGWMPNAVGDPARLCARMEELAGRAEGRELPVTVFSVRPDAESLAPFAAAGAVRAVCWLPSGPRERTERALERLAALRDVVA